MHMFVCSLALLLSTLAVPTECVGTSVGVTSVEWVVIPQWNRLAEQGKTCRWYAKVGYNVSDFRNDFNSMAYMTMKFVNASLSESKCCSAGTTYTTITETERVRTASRDSCFEPSTQYTFCTCGPEDDALLGETGTNSTEAFTPGTRTMTSCNITVVAQKSVGRIQTRVETKVSVLATDASTLAPTFHAKNSLVFSSASVSGTACDKLHFRGAEFVKTISGTQTNVITTVDKLMDYQTSAVDFSDKSKDCLDAWQKADGQVAMVEFGFDFSMDKENYSCDISWTNNASSTTAAGKKITSTEIITSGSEWMRVGFGHLAALMVLLRL